MEIVVFRKDIENIFNHFSPICLEFDLRKNCTNMHAFEAGRLKQKPLVEKTKGCKLYGVRKRKRDRAFAKRRIFLRMDSTHITVNFVMLTNLPFTLMINYFLSLLLFTDIPLHMIF